LGTEKKVVQAIPVGPGSPLKQALLSAIDVSSGPPDAGKLVLVGAGGTIDASLIGTLGGGTFNLDDGTFLASATAFTLDDGSF
jgi:hypothetical protein